MRPRRDGESEDCTNAGHAFDHVFTPRLVDECAEFVVGVGAGIV